MGISRNRSQSGTSGALILALILLPPLVNAAGPQGTIRVTTEPEGAEVFIDDQRKGVSPVIIEAVSSGEHRVRVVKHGFIENSQVVNVAPGATMTVGFEMTPASTARSEASTAPAGDPVGETQSEGWSTKKKVVAGTGVAAIVVGAIALAGGGDEGADAANTAPAAGSISVAPSGQSLAGVTNFSFTAQGASDADGQTLTYSWNFGDGATGTGQTTSHVYGTGGTFTVALSVSDGSASDDTTTSVEVGDVNATWLNRFTVAGFPEGVMRKVRFTQSGAQLSGTYRTNIIPGRTGTATGRLTSPRDIEFETHLLDSRGRDVGFRLTGRLNDDLTAFIGVGNGYLLNNRTMGFGRTAE
jgi:PKD repeat protein